MGQPNLKEEKKLWKKGYKWVAGLDEAGRGSLAGPVVAAAVMIKISNFQFPISKQISNFKFQISKLRDSKKLSSKAREKFYKILTTHPGIWWGIAGVSEKVIDKINIKNAAELAMEKALKQLEKKIKKRIDFLIIDGNHLKNLPLLTYKLKLIPKADEKVLSCAIASIIAKVTRDQIMMGYHKKYPKYRFDLHKGYGTKLHLKMLKKYGRCAIHRRSFKYQNFYREQKRARAIYGESLLRAIP
jgi:ribonuclease HII